MVTISIRGWSEAVKHLERIATALEKIADDKTSGDAERIAGVTDDVKNRTAELSSALPKTT